MRLNLRLSLAVVAAFLPASRATAQEVFGGLYKHQVVTFGSRDIGEGGYDVEIGYRHKRAEFLSFIGKPSPYVLASVNLQGDTSFVSAGLSWKIGEGKFYVRPGLGLAIHDGPARRYDPDSGRRTDLGSRLLLQPEFGIGVRVTDKAAIEAGWVHVSHTTLFNGTQNPALDMFGLRLVYSLR